MWRERVIGRWHLEIASNSKHSSISWYCTGLIDIWDFVHSCSSLYLLINVTCPVCRPCGETGWWPWDRVGSSGGKTLALTLSWNFSTDKATRQVTSDSSVHVLFHSKWGHMCPPAVTVLFRIKATKCDKIIYLKGSLIRCNACWLEFFFPLSLTYTLSWRRRRCDVAQPDLRV